MNSAKTIPKEWKKVRLGDLCKINKGEQLNKLDMIENGEYPALNGGIGPSGYTDRWNTEANTITISEGGNSCGYINFNKQRFWCGGHCYAIKEIRKDVDRDFLYQSLKSRQDDIMRLRVGSGLPNIQKRGIEDFPLLIPPINEQTKISEILSSVDSEIEKVDQEIKKTEELKRGLMAELLTKGIGHTKFKKTKLGEIPESWEAIKLQNSGIDLLDGDRGINYPKQDEFYTKEYCLFLSNKNIKDDRFIFDECMFITKEKDRLLRKGKLQRNDIVLTTRGTVGNVAYYNDSVPFENIRINSGMLILRHGKKFDPLFLYKLLSSQIMKQKYKDMGSGSAQPQLPISSLKNINIPLIPLDEQKKIAKIISDIDSKIDVNKQIKNKFAELKKGLMQDLLSGKRRII